MHWTGVLHLTAAVGALLAGLVVTLLPKGSRSHRQWGWVYAGTMVVVNITALMIYRLLGAFGPFHAAAIFSLLTVVAGILPVRRRTNRWWLARHAYWMSGSYVGLWAAAVAETATRTPLLPFWWMFVASTVVVMLLGAMLIARGVPRAVRNLRRTGIDR